MEKTVRGKMTNHLFKKKKKTKHTRCKILCNVLVKITKGKCMCYEAVRVL